MDHPLRSAAVPAFDVIASTLRSGVVVDEVEFVVPGAPPATGYLVGKVDNASQPVVLAMHDERGDKATLLPDLEYLASQGFLCLAVDSPSTRTAMRERDHLRAFESQFAIAVTALNLLQGDPDTVDHRVALLGRGIGGEVAAALAAHTFRAQVVVAIEPLLDRSDWIARSPHALAAGVRQFHDAAHVDSQVQGLAPRSLASQLTVSPDTHWLLQVADNDDRLSSNDRHALALSVPATVRVEAHRDGGALRSRSARRSRVEFISRLCG